MNASVMSEQDLANAGAIQQAAALASELAASSSMSSSSLGSSGMFTTSSSYAIDDVTMSRFEEELKVTEARIMADIAAKRSEFE